MSDGNNVEFWIDVNDRLPDYHLTVIVRKLDPDGDVVIDEDCLFMFGGTVGFPKDVTHWAFIPPLSVAQELVIADKNRLDDFG